MLTIDPDKVCHIIVKARAFDAQIGLGDPTEETGASYDGPPDGLDGDLDDATRRSSLPSSPASTRMSRSSSWH